MAVQLGTTENFTSNIDPWVGSPTTGIRQYSNGAIKRMEIDSQATASQTYTFSGYANQPFRMTLTTTEIGTWEATSDTTIIKFDGVVVYNSDVAGDLVLHGGFNSSGTVSVTITANTDASAEKLHVDNIAVYSDPNYASSNPRPFSMSYTANENGNIKMIGNSVLKDPTKTDGCADSGVNNNGIDADWVDNDGNSTSLYNSTSANLELPAGVTSSNILYAGLYWQGRVTYGTLASDYEKAKTVKLKLPGYSTYQNITTNGTKFNWVRSSGNGDDYQGVADVTNYLKTSLNSINQTIISSSGYSQTIWVADVWSTEKTNGYGAWSLVVMYKDGTTTLKNLSVYDGFEQVAQETISVPLTGFLTPSTTPVNSSFFVFAGEGDSNYFDRVSLSDKNGNDISLPVGAGANEGLFNSSVTDENGQNVTTRNPACANTIGVDIHSYSIGTNGDPAIIGTEQTSTTVKLFSPLDSDPLYSGYDTYNPGVFAFATDLYQPNMCYVEEIFNSADQNISGVGKQVNENDILKVRVTVKNNGTDVARGVQILHPFDNAQFPYITNSTYYENLPLRARTHGTEGQDSDLFEHNATAYLSKINLGSGASSAGGGNFATIASDSNAYSVYEYNATVKNVDSNFSNTYKAAYVSDFGLDYSNNPVTMEPCIGSKNSFWGYRAPTPTGTVDVVDPDKLVTYSTAPVIKTKIAKKDSVQLKVVYLNPATLAIKNYIPFIASSNQPLRVMLYRTDSPCSTSAPELALAEPTTGNLAGQPVVAYISPNENNASTNTFVMKAIASKDSKILAKYADWSSIMQGLDNTAPCFNNSNDAANFNGLPQCLNSLGSASEDNLAADLRAKYPSIATMCLNQTVGDSACDSNAYQSGGSKGYIIPSKYNHSYGCLACILDAIGDTETCSRDNFAIRPNAFNNTITANQQFTAMQPTSITFRADQFGGTGTVDYNETEHTSFVVDVNISDSTKNCQDMNISFSPSIDFIDGNVTDNYTLSNVGDFNVTMHEINGSEYALVDSDSGDTLEVDRLITPYQVQIKVVPDHFALDGNLTNGSNGFTYLSNFEQYDTNDSRNISAVLDMNISALAADNNITTNYNASCYAKSGNLTLSLANAIAVTPSGALSKVIWYHYAPDHNGSIVFNGTTQYSIPFLNTQFDNNDTNGTGQFDYRINFDRNQILLVNPFNIVINEINATDTDSVDGNRTMSTNNNAYYVYGRIIPRDIRVFGGATPFTANAYYEVYNAPSINGTLPASKNESGWYTNTQHSDLSTTYDGDANVTYIGSAALAPPMSSNVGNDGTEDYTDSDGMALGGYKAHINTDPWLWHGLNALGYADPGMNVNGTVDGTVNSDDCINHPCFNITVVPSIGATGSAKSTNEGTKASKKSDSGGGTWKSTSDYAPAIR